MFLDPIMIAFPSIHLTDVPLSSLVTESTLREKLPRSAFTSVTDAVNIATSWYTGLGVRAVDTDCLNSTRVDCPDGEISSTYYTSEGDIISRTYPIRWSSELTHCP